MAAQMLQIAALEGDQSELVWSYTRADCLKLYPRLDAYLQNRLLPNIAKSRPERTRIAQLYETAKHCLPADAKPELDKAAEEISFQARLKGRLLPHLQQILAAPAKSSTP
jgi:hypothetical protein